MLIICACIKPILLKLKLKLFPSSWGRLQTSPAFVMKITTKQSIEWSIIVWVVDQSDQCFKNWMLTLSIACRLTWKAEEDSTKLITGMVQHLGYAELLYHRSPQVEPKGSDVFLAGIDVCVVPATQRQRRRRRRRRHQRRHQLRRQLREKSSSLFPIKVLRPTWKLW